MSPERKLLAMVGFVALGLSPSFVDWRESPADRRKIVAYYAVALALIYFGLFAP